MMYRFLRIGVFLFLLFQGTSCQKTELPITLGYSYPRGFPAMEIPLENQFDPIRIELGKKLFFDPVLSSDSTISCGSCHLPGFAFSDTLKVSLGVKNRMGARNTPSLANVGYQRVLLREGGVPTLEMQVLVPVQEHNEFDSDLLMIAKKISANPVYRELANKAYGRDPDPWVITRAIAAFERSLISGDSDFDKWFYKGNPWYMTASSKRGFQLFTSERLACSQCHSGFLFTNQDYTNNGLYEVYPDSGRIRLTGLDGDRASFKIPSLRNVAVTAPYMHDGSLVTLEEVIEHYVSGGTQHANKSPLIKPIVLNMMERQDLIHFLESLTDQAFLTNSKFNIE